MSGFFGYKLSEVATVAVMLLAFIPVTKAAAAFNFLPVIGCVVTFAGLSTVRRLSFGLRIFISLLVAMILVPTPFRGRRVWENFEDAEDTEKEKEKEEFEDGDGQAKESPPEEEEQPTRPTQMEPAQMEPAQVETMKNLSDKDEEEGPDASNIEALSAKFLGTKSKKYRLPSEKEDGNHHMDTGTTFMNAYKKLKPEQIQALTSDTQKLITVQKDLMANLNNLKPLVSDGKEIMKTFKSFFGSEPSSN
jgi:hypothetical protein